MVTPLNPFDALDTHQMSDWGYFETNQYTDDDAIVAWIDYWVNSGRGFWKDPFVQLNERSKTNCLHSKIAPGMNGRGVVIRGFE